MPEALIKQFGKVAVLLGGQSGEREISLKSGRAVYRALQQAGVDVHMVDPAEQDWQRLKDFDRAFITLHGRFGEDGTIQGALELMDIPYTGSGVMASAIGMDKWRTKLLWRANGVITPDFLMLNAQSDWRAVCETLGLPLFVKPANEGSSIGISKVKTVDEMQAAYARAFASDPLVMAEQAIIGGEYTVGILGDSALPIVRIVPKNEYYDFDAKYLSDATEYHCPSGLTQQKEQQIQQEALHAFKTIGCSGWGRVDFLMDANGQHYFLELNTSPGMTDHSLVPMAARAAGFSFEDLVIAILRTTLDVSVEQKAYVG